MRLSGTSENSEALTTFRLLSPSYGFDSRREQVRPEEEKPLPVVFFAVEAFSVLLRGT